MQKSQTLVSEPHFVDVRGDARPWLMARWKARSIRDAKASKPDWPRGQKFGLGLDTLWPWP